MLEGKNFFQIMQMGGFTLLVLFLCSVVSVAIILERAIAFRNNSRVKRADFMAKLRELLKSRNIEAAVMLCDNTNAPYARVVKSGLQANTVDTVKVMNSMDRQISSEVNNLEKFTSILGSIGSTVVYIGLFGTVIGIIKAFQDIALTSANGAGINAVVAGVAEALISTAAGILVAVPAVFAYNLLMKKIDNFTNDMEICASEVKDSLGSKEKAF
jgi:biopolymer transport protein ExbB